MDATNTYFWFNPNPNKKAGQSYRIKLLIYKYGLKNVLL